LFDLPFSLFVIYATLRFNSSFLSFLCSERDIPGLYIATSYPVPDAPSSRIGSSSAAYLPAMARIAFTLLSFSLSPLIIFSSKATLP